MTDTHNKNTVPAWPGLVAEMNKACEDMCHTADMLKAIVKKTENSSDLPYDHNVRSLFPARKFWPDKPLTKE